MSTDRQQLFYRCRETFNYTRPLKLWSDCQSFSLLLMCRHIFLHSNLTSDLYTYFSWTQPDFYLMEKKPTWNVLTAKVASIFESLSLFLTYCIIKFWVLVFSFSFKVYVLYVLNLEIKCVKWEQKDLEQHGEGCSQNKERIWAALPASLTELLSRA